MPYEHRLSPEVIDQIAVYDPRYAGHTETGAIAIVDPETGVVSTYTHGEYLMLAEPSTREVLFCTIDVRKQNLLEGDTYDVATVVGWMDEMRRLLSNLVDEHKAVTKSLMAMAFPRDDDDDL